MNCFIRYWLIQNTEINLAINDVWSVGDSDFAYACTAQEIIESTSCWLRDYTNTNLPAVLITCELLIQISSKENKHEILQSYQLKATTEAILLAPILMC